MYIHCILMCGHVEYIECMSRHVDVCMYSHCITVFEISLNMT